MDLLTQGMRNGKNAERAEQAHTESTSDTETDAESTPKPTNHSRTRTGRQIHAQSRRRHGSARRVNVPCQPTPEVAKEEKPPGGKRLSDIDQAKNDATSKASDVGRQLAFAGIATVWLLRDESARPISNLLLFALLFLSTALLVDFLQYVYCSRVWKSFYNEQFNKHNSDDARVDIPDSLSKPIYRFFWIKIGLLIFGYSFLLSGAAVKLRIF